MLQWLDQQTFLKIRRKEFAAVQIRQGGGGGEGGREGGREVIIGAEVVESWLSLEFFDS